MPPAAGALGAYRDTDFPSGNTPWREATFTVIDLETTGLDPTRDEIISFAAVTVTDGKVRLDDARYELVRPDRMPDAETIRIHGLREADLTDAPSLAAVLERLLEPLTGRALVAHVAAVERGFLGTALRPYGARLRNPIIDTAMLDRELRRLRGAPDAEREPIGLSAMARELNLPVHRPHHAEGDALTTAQAFIALATHLEAFETPLTLGRLQRLSEREGRYRRRGLVRRLIRRLRV
ncbi:MAG TPA: exonuclease domain-containing protein [Solirubrobacterales bacterium]|nr:exonuclease domain-containing protein [Solirubrobacterales bacterium]